MIIRFAEEKELVRINELRKQVNDLHVIAIKHEEEKQ